jgi:hypothetical protein
MNHVKIPQVYEKTTPLAHNEHGILLKYGIDEKQRASAYAKIPKGQRNDASAFPFACYPLNEESAEKEALADKAQYKQIIVTAITDNIAQSE